MNLERQAKAYRTFLERLKIDDCYQLLGVRRAAIKFKTQPPVPNPVVFRLKEVATERSVVTEVEIWIYGSA